MAASKGPARKTGLVSRLAPQEIKILNLLANGYTNLEVARVMLIDVDAVRRYIDVMHHKVAPSTGLNC